MKLHVCVPLFQLWEVGPLTHHRTLLQVSVSKRLVLYHASFFGAFHDFQLIMTGDPAFVILRQSAWLDVSKFEKGILGAAIRYAREYFSVT